MNALLKPAPIQGLGLAIKDLKLDLLEMEPEERRLMPKYVEQQFIMQKYATEKRVLEAPKLVAAKAPMEVIVIDHAARHLDSFAQLDCRAVTSLI